MRVDPRPWQVIKFGGTSVTGVERWRAIASILESKLNDKVRPFVVCSAISGVTNQLEALIQAACSGSPVEAHLKGLVERHRQQATELGVDADNLLNEVSAELAQLLAGGPPGPAARAQILATGERLSTKLGALWLNQEGMSTGWLDARALLRTTEASEESDEETRFLAAIVDETPDPTWSQELAARPESVLLTQGFIGANARGELVVLGRGGSDTAASCLAAKLGADKLEVWTDVPGTFTTDPRLCPDARLLREVDVDTVATMASLGAKVLHPRSLDPVRRHQFPIEIRWTARPTEPAGTRIIPPDASRPPGLTGVCMRGGLHLLCIEQPSTWQPIGFMAEVSARFAEAGLSMDLLGSSPGAIKATVDPAAFPGADAALESLVNELQEQFTVTHLTDLACVSLVGTEVGAVLPSVHEALAELEGVHVHLTSHGADDQHVSFVVDKFNARPLLQALHACFLQSVEGEARLGAPWSKLMAPSSSAAPTAA